MNAMMLRIMPCSTDTDYAAARKISKDYVEWLNMDLTFQGIENEFDEFRTIYGPPQGAFLVAISDNQAAGGVGLRQFEADICEMKRLYVYDGFQGKGIGEALCKKLIQLAKQMGYSKMRLDTVGRLGAAIQLYEKIGFSDIEPYRHNPDPTTRYMELNLIVHT
jgi:GNAT superfamily N-acetyltransferase